MQNRTISYLKERKARKVLEHPITSNLFSFLNATFRLSRNNIVKRDIQNTLFELQSSYKMSA